MHFNVWQSFRLIRLTAPFVLFRAAVYFGIAAAYVVATGTGAGIGWVVGALGDADFRAGAIFWGGAIGFGTVAAFLYFLREYTLYLVKAGHIAVMIEALDRRELPSGRAQIDYAQTIVRERFGEASALFAIDQLVKGVLRVAVGIVGGFMAMLPVPGLGRLVRPVDAFLKIAVGLLDEVILAHAIRTRSANPYGSARTALVLYAQNAKPLIVDAAWLTAITWILSLVVFLLMLAPAAFVVWILPGTLAAGSFVFAVLFAWAIKVALIEPFAIACMLQAYFAVTAGQEPNPHWIGKLDAASAKFHKLGQQATRWATAGPTVDTRPEADAPVAG